MFDVHRTSWALGLPWVLMYICSSLFVCGMSCIWVCKARAHSLGVGNECGSQLMQH